MASNTHSSNYTDGLHALSTITGKQEYITSTSGVLNSGATLSGSIIPASGLTSAAAVQIVDGSGNQITNFGGGGSLPTTPIYGHQAVTATATALAAGVLSNGVIITGLSTNSISVFVGGASVTTSTGAELQPGAALSAAIANTQDLYVIASTTGATVTWLGS